MQELSANTIEIIAGAGPEPGPIEPQMPKMDPFFIPDFTKDAKNGKLPPSIEGPGGVKPFVWYGVISVILRLE